MEDRKGKKQVGNGGSKDGRPCLITGAQPGPVAAGNLRLIKPGRMLLQPREPRRRELIPKDAPVRAEEELGCSHPVQGPGKLWKVWVCHVELWALKEPNLGGRDLALTWPNSCQDPLQL